MTTLLLAWALGIAVLAALLAITVIVSRSATGMTALQSKLALNVVPLATFLAANFSLGIFAGTEILMAALTITLLISRAVTGRWLVLAVPHAILVLIFGSLTLALGDATLIKLEPTISNALLGCAPAAAYFFHKPILATFQINEVTSRKHALWWTAFFFSLAVLNELIWRTQSTNFWVNFQLLGFVPLTFVFAAPRYLPFVMPLAGFAALGALFFVRLGAGDASRIPSALIGHDAPATDLPPVPGLERDGKPIPGLATADFKGAVTVLNVWASWCVPCHDEAPLLMQLASDSRIRLVGINYKDQADNARRFLGRYGNPFTASGADVSGRTAIEWGVYGVPETFIIGRDGKIAYKLVGPITPENINQVMKPEIEKALASS